MQKQTKNGWTEKPHNKQLTPIEQLIAEKIDIEHKCHKQEKKLNEDFAYIQNNASSIILSSIPSLFFPSNNKTNTIDQSSSTSNSDQSKSAKAVNISIADYMTMAKNLLPLAWEIAQPIIITWSIKKAKSLLLGAFTKKRK